MPTNTKFLMEAYKDATRKPHSYIFLDATPTTEDKYRIRTNVLPHEAPQYVYIPNTL
jgi:late competence protein required for DNA uptake (superfamily II DNA/RNA helicase)